MIQESKIRCISTLLVLATALLTYCEKTPITQTSPLPRLELTISPDHLWSPDSGLYVIGSNGIEGPCSPHPANYHQKWEHPAHIKYYENDELAFEQDLGFRIKGFCARNFAMKSLGLYWRSEYGYKNLEYPIFHGEGGGRFKRLVLRNAGNEFGRTHLRDAINAAIIKGVTEVDAQNYQPCVVHLNGDYWGIHNIRENVTARQLAYRYNVDHEAMDILHFNTITPATEQGSDADYKQNIIAFISENDLSIQANFDQVEALIEIANYIDFIIIETYVNNMDWPDSNTLWWRDETSPFYNKWRWFLVDTDMSCEVEDIGRIWIGDLFEKDGYREDRANGFFLFNHLIKNDNFRLQFLERYQYFLDEVYTEERAASIVQSLKSEIQPEYANHAEKWGVINEKKWSEEVDEIETYFRLRHPIMQSTIDQLIAEEQ